jgi:tryptophanyl-tRNA synthetase
VYAVHELVTAKEIETRMVANACIAAQIWCVECKHRLVDGIAKILEPFQEARAKLNENDSYINEILHEGGKKADGQ